MTLGDEYEDIAVEDGTPGDNMRPARRHRPAGRSTAAERRSAPSNPSSASAPPMCHLCSEAIIGQEPHKLKGFSFHDGACWNAIRAHRRIFAGARAELLKSDGLMLSDPATWRMEVAPLIRRPGETRDRLARNIVKSKRQVKENFQATEEIEDLLLLNKKRFIMHRRDNDDANTSDASDEFVELLTNQGSQYSRDGEPRVAVRDVVRIRQRIGCKQSFVQESALLVDDAAALGGPSAPSGSAGPGAPRRRTPSRRADRRRRRDRPRRRDDATRHDDEDEDDDDLDLGATADTGPADDACSVGARSRGSALAQLVRASRPGAPKRSRALSSDSAAGDIGTDDDMTTPITKRHKTTAPTASPNQLSASGTKMSALQFMKLRMDLKTRLQKTVAQHKMKTSTMNKAKAARDRLTTKQLNTLEVDPSDCIHKLNKLVNELCKIADSIDVVKSAGWDEFLSNAEDNLEKINIQNTAAFEHLQAMQFLLTEAGKVKKSEANSKRFRITMTADRFQRGGFTESFARALIDRIPKSDNASLSCNPEDFDPSAITLWTSGAEGKCEKMLSFVSALQAAGVDIKSKSEVIDRSLQAKCEWKGAMVAVESKIFDFDGCPIQNPMFTSEPGASPWLVGFRPNSWRFGPFAWPLPGFGSLAQLSFETPLQVHLLLIPAVDVLLQGVSLKDVRTYLDTPSGASMFSEKAKLIRMVHGELVWIPYGYMTIPIASFPESATDKKDTDSEPMKASSSDAGSVKNLADGIAYVWTWTPFVVKSAMGLEDTAWQAISGWNREYCEQHVAQRLWSERGKVLGHFVQEVQKARLE